MANVKLIWGGASIMDNIALPEVDALNEFLDILQARGVTNIDTARVYANSEERLGAHADSRFAIDSKYPGGVSQEPSTPESLVSILQQSLDLLQTDQLDIYYIHAPDRRISFEDLEALLAAINTQFQAGKFKRFGLSNFLANEIEEVIRITRGNDWVTPAVYQGNYSTIARRTEDEILPTLRKHNISFYAYSPIARGFLAKDAEEFVAGKSRWDTTTFTGRLYDSLYNKPRMLESLKLWGTISQKSEIPKAELAYRWVVYHSALKGELRDGLVFGSRNLEQLKQTLDGIDNGPLSADVVSQIEDVWKLVEADAPLDNWNSSTKS
ncbi:Aldo/keto reductase subgroup [Penicillium brevicompactum]|uniref:Aldo/keto reductase subgroup n=1 Tax=Penicillium brevicompactum TaxID=5074 RepID=UPI00253FFD7C|nr:Aldo/keto reductase subgroup [Penicillium brevicompactum]KAJ5327424.1 Aldo/keto reductase subgroup [Penicillium brevicompactum]